MGRSVQVLATCVAVFAGGISAVQAAEKPSPRQRTAQLLDALMRVQKIPEKRPLSSEEKARNQQAFAALDDYFDFAFMTRAVIAPHKKVFTEEQLSEFYSIFPELIRLVAYPKAGTFLKNVKREINGSRIEGSRHLVEMRVSNRETDMEMQVTFYWEDQGPWRLVDVAFDGASLTKDYMNQLGRVIDKEGVPALLRKVAKRRAEELKVLR